MVPPSRCTLPYYNKTAPQPSYQKIEATPISFATYSLRSSSLVTKMYNLTRFSLFVITLDTETFCPLIGGSFIKFLYLGTFRSTYVSNSPRNVVGSHGLCRF